jgi:Baseplate J-like protein
VGATVFSTVTATRHTLDGVSRLIVPLVSQRGAPTIWRLNLAAVPTENVQIRKIPTSDNGDEVDAYDEITLADGPLVHYVVADSPPVGVVSKSAPAGIVMDGDPGNLASGQWVLLAEVGAKWEARRISALERSDDSFAIQFDAAPGAIVTAIHAELAIELAPAGHDRNLQPAFATDQSVVGNSIISLTSVPESLDKGRRLIVQGASRAVAATVVAVDREQSFMVISPALPGDGDGGDAAAFTRHGTAIYANVALCGHGETRPAKILGSGDATKSNQSFELKVEGLAFVADATQAAGVRAAIEVAVGDRIWQQVATLNDSGPTDHHYEVRMTQEGYVEIRFGDGQHGRRLPTGASNVRAVYRAGSGSAGNLPAESLGKSVKPHPLIASVRQPLPASGGGDMESADSLRQNAPASLLALGRAVSLRDFTHLAGRHSSVWHARAFALPTGLARHETVEVVIVPAGGGDLTESLRTDLATYLEAIALPGVEVVVTQFVPIVLDLDVTVRVQTSAFDPEVVIRDVRAALEQAFALQRSAFARPLYRAALFEVVEAVTGVENSVCTIRETTVQNGAAPRRIARGPSQDIRLLVPADNQIIFIDPALSQIDVTYQEFTL